MKSVLVNNVTDKAEENIKAIDAYLENNKHSAFGTIEERRRWFTERIELDSKRYEIASVIYSKCDLTAPYEQIEESLRIIERDAESTEEFNKIKQNLRRLLSEIHNIENSYTEDSEEAAKLEDFLEDRSESGWEYDDNEEEAIDFLAAYDADDYDDYDTSGCKAEIASILGLKIDEGVDLPF